MVALGAAEGAAGNLSIFVRTSEAPPYPEQATIALPVNVLALAGGWLIVTGSGRRLRDVRHSPQTTLCWLYVHDNGTQATLHAAASLRPTSELNTHLAAHSAQVAANGLTLHAVVHAQPLRLTYLSHIARYHDPATLSRRLLRWQPETIMEFPEGIGTLPFEMPGSDEQARVTAAALQRYRAVVWQKHGIVARATQIGKATDLVEYAEAAAHYEYLNLGAGEPASGLTDAELRLISDRLGLKQQVI